MPEEPWTQELYVQMVPGSLASATVYRTPANDQADVDTFYFCCNECGACGRRWTGHRPASEQATNHITESHPSKEHHNG